MLAGAISSASRSMFARSGPSPATQTSTSPSDGSNAAARRTYSTPWSGKKLVTRDMMEEQTRALKNQVTDLQFDRLGKLQKEQDRLDRDRRMLLSAVRRLEGERLAFEAATEEELLALAVAKSEKGSLYLLVCKRCGYRETCQLGTKQYTSTIRSCPCCYTTLVQRDLAVDLKRRRRTIELVQVHSDQ